MESKHFLFAVSLFLLSKFAQGERHDVDCMHQQEKCVCNSTATECYFELEVEELQTFTSYMLNRQGAIVTRGTPGDTYYWEGNELTPSILCTGDRDVDVSECGFCLQESFQSFYILLNHHYAAASQ